MEAGKAFTLEKCKQAPCPLKHFHSIMFLKRLTFI